MGRRVVSDDALPALRGGGGGGEESMLVYASRFGVDLLWFRVGASFEPPRILAALLFAEEVKIPTLKGPRGSGFFLWCLLSNAIFGGADTGLAGSSSFPFCTAPLMAEDRRLLASRLAFLDGDSITSECS
jgi:hypothetical protein